MDGIFGQTSIKFSSMIYSSKYVDSILNDRENRNREKCDHCVNVKVAFLCFSTTFFISAGIQLKAFFFSQQMNAKTAGFWWKHST